MKKYQTTLLAGVAALALVAGTGLASAQQSKEHMGGSQAASPQAGQSMNKGSQTQAQEKGKATQSEAREKGKATQTEAREKTKGTETQAQEKGKTSADRTAETGKENMNPSGRESQKMGKRGARAEHMNRGEKGSRQAERKDTLKGLRGDASKPMQGENEKQEGSKSSTKGNTSNQAQEKTPQNNMQRGERGTESTQRGTESTQRGTESGTNMQRGTESNRGSAQVNERGGSRTAEGVNVQLNDQQRSEIKTTVIEGRNAPRVGHVDFDVRVGTAIPRGRIHVVPVPETLVRIEPSWRGFLYFVYEDEVVVVDPHDYKIVAVLPV